MSLSGQTDLLKLYARVINWLQQAKLNLFADKILCNRDSSKCMSEGHNVQEKINYAGFVYLLLTPTNPKIEHCISFTHRRRFFPVSLFI